GHTLYCRAECYRTTRSIAFTRAVAFHDDPDDPVATASGAFIIDRPRETA
ncbi:MAG: thioesterase, partial [Pseudomonadota bacterium]